MPRQRRAAEAEHGQPDPHPLTETGACELCGRIVSQASLSRHHIVPRSEGGTLTINLCSACHRTVHRFFRNRTLARELNSVAALRANPDIARYLKWVQRQPDRQIRVRTSRRRR